MKQLPNTVFVFCDNEGTADEFLQCEKSMDALVEFGKRKLVGEYELKRQVEVTAKADILCTVG